ncbi:hypothetical protein B0H14DRAFT_3444920 [Mycena olivaceomarginata]|nr:hypothetical protein B0H14DRAFT_3444920 [Mycena olivaceomarginata]
MDMYTVQVRGGDVVRAVVGHKVRVPFSVGLMDDRLAAVDSPLPSTIATLKPLRPHVHRFDVLGPLRRQPPPAGAPQPALSSPYNIASSTCASLHCATSPAWSPLSSSLSPSTLHRYTVAYAALARPISSHQRSQGYSKLNVLHAVLPPPGPCTAAADAAQAQADLEGDRSAQDKQGWPRVVAQLSM